MSKDQEETTEEEEEGREEVSEEEASTNSTEPRALTRTISNLYKITKMKMKMHLFRNQKILEGIMDTEE